MPPAWERVAKEEFSPGGGSVTDPRLSGLLRCLSQRAGEGSTAAGSPGAPGGGWWARWPLSPEGRERQGWFFGASEHHQFWPPPLGTPNLSWQRPARQRALPLLFLLWTASAPQEWPSFLIISESGDSSEMLWEVVERGVEGHAAEGGEEVCTAEGVAVVWGPEGVLEDCTEDRTEVLKEARMEERISNCSVEGWRLGMASRFSLEGCLLDSGSRLSLDSCLRERLPRFSCEGCLLGTVPSGSLELDLLERKSSCSLEVCLADASWSLEGCLRESKSNCSRDVSRLGNVSIRSLDTCLLGNVFSHSLETSLTSPQSSCSLDPNLQGKVSRWSLEPCLRGSVFP